jgi:hypothetical protein
MLKLAKSGSAAETDTTLGISSSTKKFLVQGHCALISATGVLSTNTMTVKASADGKNGTFFTYMSDGTSGTPEARTITITEVPDATSIFSFVVYGPGQVYRIDSNDQGSGVDVDFRISGDVNIYEDT